MSSGVDTEQQRQRPSPQTSRKAEEEIKAVSPKQETTHSRKIFDVGEKTEVDVDEKTIKTEIKPDLATESGSIGVASSADGTSGTHTDSIGCDDAESSTISAKVPRSAPTSPSRSNSSEKHTEDEVATCDKASKSAPETTTTTTTSKRTKSDVGGTEKDGDGDDMVAAPAPKKTKLKNGEAAGREEGSEGNSRGASEEVRNGNEEESKSGSEEPSAAVEERLETSGMYFLRTSSYLILSSCPIKKNLQ